MLLICAILSFWLTFAWAEEYILPKDGDDLIGKNYVVEVHAGDSLTTIRQKHGISYNELLGANPGVNFQDLHIGQKIIIPKQFILPYFREGIVINVPELRLYYFTPDKNKVFTFPVGLGREQWRTPLTSTKVTGKRENPSWHVPTSIRNYVLNKTGKALPAVVGPGPSNPLGKYAIYLGIDNYLIHGTNAPTTVGAFISSGCVRLLRAPLELLFNQVRVGTPVRIIHYPIKAGWLGNGLYLESHPVIGDYQEGTDSMLSNSNLQMILELVTKGYDIEIDQAEVENVLRMRSGIPTLIGNRRS